MWTPMRSKYRLLGGHSGATILPLCSQAESSVELDEVLGGGGLLFIVSSFSVPLPRVHYR